MVHLMDEKKFAGKFKKCTSGLYTLKNKNGIIVQITNLGAKVVSIFVPDKTGKVVDIVLGYNSIEEYIQGNPFFGAICGRYANRIANGKFSIGETSYQLNINNGPNALHGGPEGFNNQMFTVKEVLESHDKSSVSLSYFSKHMEEGYPGNFSLTVTYTLNQRNELWIDFFGKTDQITPVNICSHSFFNLAGEASGDILNHNLKINAEKFTPVNPYLIPTGEFWNVKDTPMDFLEFKRIGRDIHESYEQLTIGCGYDHNWVINKSPGELGLAATYVDPESCRMMEVYTTQPGIQVYTGNWLDGSDVGKSNKAYPKQSAICLETQHFPDSPNHPEFPSTLLKPDDSYQHTCMYRFSIY